MPEISRFHGIVIAMFFNDHSPPHFHAFHGAYEAGIAITDGVPLWGSLPRSMLALVERWRRAHVAELMENWDRARARRALAPVAPLE